MANCKIPHDCGQELVKYDSGEELVKSAVVAMAMTIGAADITKKVESTPLSDNSIKRRIDSIDRGTEKAGKFSLQTDQSVDTADNRCFL